jgi:hypothetical protein
MDPGTVRLGFARVAPHAVGAQAIVMEASF